MVNLSRAVVSYAHGFSSVTEDFISANRKIARAIRTTRAWFPHQQLRLVGDAGLDDQKVFHQIDRVPGECLIRACRLNRQVEVSNDRLDRWERESLQDLVAAVPFSPQLQVAFTHARRWRTVTVELTWLK